MTVYSEIGGNFNNITGTGSDNTLDYTNDFSGVRIDLQFIDQPSPVGFAFTGGGWFNTFTDIQNFVGSSAGNNSFQSVGSGDYSFTGKGGNNTLDYTYDTDQGVTVNLLTDTASKDFTFSSGGKFGPISVSWAEDTFSDIQNFIGSSGGANVFQSVGTGYYNFTGTGSDNTLNYSSDTDGVTIEMGGHAVLKDMAFVTLPVGVPVPLGPYIDTFSNIQTMVGLVGAGDTVDFSGALNQYAVVTNPDGSITVTDSVAGRDGSMTFDQVENLKFTNTTVTEAFLGGSFTNSGQAINDIYNAVLQHSATSSQISTVEATATASGDAAAISSIVNSSEAQYNVNPVIQIIELATGVLPNATQLSGWVAAVEADGLLTGQAQTNPLMDNMAEAFVASTMFGNTFNGGTAVDPNAAITASIVSAIIQAATGVAATQTQIHNWVATGETIDQVFVEFALGDQYTAHLQGTVQHYLTSAAEYAASADFAGASSSVLGSVPASELIHG